MYIVGIMRNLHLQKQIVIQKLNPPDFDNRKARCLEMQTQIPPTALVYFTDEMNPISIWMGQ